MAPLIRLVISRHTKIYIYIYLGPEAQSAENAKRKKNLWIFCLQLSPGPEGKPETGTLFVSRILRNLIFNVRLRNFMYKDISP